MFIRLSKELISCINSIIYIVQVLIIYIVQVLIIYIVQVLMVMKLSYRNFFSTKNKFFSW